jgi:hypothetical protein
MNSQISALAFAILLCPAVLSMDEIVSQRTVIIKSKYYNDEAKRENYYKALGRNSNVEDLTIYVRNNNGIDNIFAIEDRYQNFRKFIQNGLVNKPNLKKLTFIGSLAVSDFTLLDYAYTAEYSSDKLMAQPHLEFIGNIEEITILGNLFLKLQSGIYTGSFLIKIMRHF